MFGGAGHESCVAPLAPTINVDESADILYYTMHDPALADQGEPMVTSAAGNRKRDNEDGAVAASGTRFLDLSCW